MSVHVQYIIVCDGCGAKMTGSRKSPNLKPHLAYKQAAQKAYDAGWVTKNCGSKGDKRYCRGCLYSTPEIATWHAQKVLKA
jgi:hypothetical protein